MMFPNRAHKSCLRSIFARFFREAHLLADPHLIELAAFHAIAVKINLTAIRCGYETVISVRVKRRDNPMRRNFMLLHMPLPLPDDVLKLPARSLESVPDGDVNILMGAGWRQNLRWQKNTSGSVSSSADNQIRPTENELDKLGDGPANLQNYGNPATKARPKLHMGVSEGELVERCDISQVSSPLPRKDNSSSDVSSIGAGIDIKPDWLGQCMNHKLPYDKCGCLRVTSFRHSERKIW
jgi:hypothetical protein